MAAYLRLVDGIELVTHQDDGEQMGFTDFDGRFRGHVDGVIRGLHQAPKAPHVWEHKDTKERKFNEFRKIKTKHGEKDALKHWNVTYYGQAQIYMHYIGCKRHYMTISLSGVRDFDSCRTEYDKGYSENLIQRADRIINGQSIPERISNKPDYWQCRFCDFAEECHGVT